LDDDQDGEGNVCEKSGVVQSEVTSSSAAEQSASGHVSGGGNVMDATKSYELKVVCGARNLAQVNIAMRIPGVVTAIDFANCLPPDPDTKIGDCSPSTVLGDNVSPGLTVTLGQQIPTPIGKDPIPPDVFIVSAVGSLEAGLAAPVLCTVDTEAVLGTLTLTDIGDASPVVGIQGLAQLGRSVMVEANVDTVADVAAQNTTVKTTPAVPLGTLEISPAIDDPFAVRRTQITLNASRWIGDLTWGLQMGPGVQPSDASFGGCTGDTTINGIALKTCSANSDLGPGLNPANTFVLLANELPLLDGILADTMYVISSGQFVQFDPDSNPGLSVNHTDQNSLVGNFEFAAPGSVPPDITFEGASALLAVFDPEGPTAPVVPTFSSDPISDANLILFGGFDPNEDKDGDGICDDCDNCLEFENPDQLDDGSFGVTAAEAATGNDGIGNLCQCGNGEVANALRPGSVYYPDDILPCRLALNEDPSISSDAAALCSVAGDPGLSSEDILNMELVGLGLTTEISILQACPQWLGTN